MHWKELRHVDQLDEIIAASYNNPQVIFKHSTTCSISTMAKLRIESKWDHSLGNIKFHFLDLLNYRQISNTIAEIFQVHHESPQIILIKDGEAHYDASHFDISIEELKESLKFIYG